MAYVKQPNTITAATPGAMMPASETPGWSTRTGALRRRPGLRAMTHGRTGIPDPLDRQPEFVRGEPGAQELALRLTPDQGDAHASRGD